MRNSLYFSILFLFLNWDLDAQSSHATMADFQQAINQANTQQDKLNLSLRYTQELIDMGRLADAEHFAQIGIEIAANEDLPSEEARAWDALGITYKERFDYIHAMNAFSQSLKLGEQLANNKIISRAKYHIGLVFFKQGDYENAEKIMLEALKMREYDRNLSGLAMGNHALAELYSERKLYGKAIEHYRTSMNYFIEANQLDQAANVVVELGNLAFTLNDYEGALVYHRQAFNLHTGNNDRLAVAKDYVNIGNALIPQSEINEAISSFETAQVIAAEVKDSLTELTAMLCLSDLFQKNGNKKRSSEWLQKAANLGNVISVQPGLELLLLRLSQSFANSGNVTQAYQFLKLQNNARNAFFNLDKNKTILELHTRYQSEIAAESHQAKLNQLQQREAVSAKLRWTLLAMLAWAFIGLWALWTRVRAKKRGIEMLTKKNAEIDEKNNHLTEMNVKMDEINLRLVQEIAEREMMQKTSIHQAENLALFADKLKAPVSELLQRSNELISKVEQSNPSLLSALMSLQFNVNHLQVYVNDLLAFHEIESDKLTPVAVEFDIRQVLQRVESSFKPLFKELDKDIVIHVDGNIPLTLVGDSSKLSQIISNVLHLCMADKTYKAASLYVRMEQKFRTSCELRLVINGITCPSALITEDSSTQESFMGQSQSGNQPSMSWAISKRLTELQNGTMTTDRLVGDAEQLNILLPFKLLEQGTITGGVQLERLKVLFNGKRVLLVEDNKINQLVVKNLLTKLGMQVQTADDGTVALELFDQQYFDLVLMDIQLPTLDGYRTTAAMRRAIDPRKQKTPIIAMTASAYLTDRDKALLFQMNEYIGKPFSTEELLEKVALIISHS